MPDEYAFGSLDELGEGYGFRKIRQALGVEAFGVNAVVMPPGYEGFHHYHDEQDELYFVHSGTARVEVGGETREVGPGGLFHVRSTTPRRVSNAGEDDLVVLIVGGKGGYVGRDGQMVDLADVDVRRRRAVHPVERERVVGADAVEEGGQAVGRGVVHGSSFRVTNSSRAPSSRRPACCSSGVIPWRPSAALRV